MIFIPAVKQGWVDICVIELKKGCPRFLDSLFLHLQAETAKYRDIRNVNLSLFILLPD